MSQPAGDTEIGNMALTLLGTATRIQNINQGGAVADAARTALSFRPRELIELHNWNFAMRRQILTVTQAEASADEEYPWAIDLPPECLRWVPWSEDDVHYFEAEQYGNQLLVTDSAPKLVRYVADVTDRTQWTPLFVRALAALTAHDMCEAVAADKGTRDRMLAQYDDAILLAKRSDTLATGKTSRPAAVHLSNAVAAMTHTGRRDPGRWHR